MTIGFVGESIRSHAPSTGDIQLRSDTVPPSYANGARWRAALTGKGYAFFTRLRGCTART